MIPSQNAHTRHHLTTFPNTEKRVKLKVRRIVEYFCVQDFPNHFSIETKNKEKLTDKIVKPMLNQVSNHVQQQNYFL